MLTYSEAIRRCRSKDRLITATMLSKVDPLLLERLGFLFSLRSRKDCDHVMDCSCARCVAWDMFAWHGKSREQVATWVAGREKALEQFDDE